MEALTESSTQAPTETPAESPTELLTTPTYAPTETPAGAAIESLTKAPAETSMEALTESPTQPPTGTSAKSRTELPTAPTDVPTEAPVEPRTSVESSSGATTFAPDPTKAPTEAPSSQPTPHPGLKPALRVSSPRFLLVTTRLSWVTCAMEVSVVTGRKKSLGVILAAIALEVKLSIKYAVTMSDLNHAPSVAIATMVTDSFRVRRHVAAWVIRLVNDGQNVYFKVGFFSILCALPGVQSSPHHIRMIRRRHGRSSNSYSQRCAYCCTSCVQRTTIRY